MTTASTAARLMPPLHGMLAGFPLAFFTGALASDIAYAQSANMQWANFAVWLIAGGVIMAILAGLVGIADALLVRSALRRRSSFHSVLTVVLLIVAIINGFVHSRDAWTSVVPTGLVLSIFTTLLVLATSWLGYAAGAPVREVRA